MLRNCNFLFKIAFCSYFSGSINIYWLLPCCLGKVIFFFKEMFQYLPICSTISLPPSLPSCFLLLIWVSPCLSTNVGWMNQSSRQLCQLRRGQKSIFNEKSTRSTWLVGAMQRGKREEQEKTDVLIFMVSFSLIPSFLFSVNLVYEQKVVKSLILNRFCLVTTVVL